MKLDKKIDKIVISEKRLRQRVRQLAQQICRDYKGKKVIHALVFLKGAFVFAADLIREINKLKGPAVKVNFIKVSTYGKEIKKTGEVKREVKIELDPKDIKGEEILVIEDLIDQAFTLSKLKPYLLKNRQAKSLKFCVLIDKVQTNPTTAVKKAKASFHVDYLGFSMADRWLAGYGIDAGEDFRDLPYVVFVKEKYYMS